MKVMETLLNVIAKKKPRDVFKVRMGDRVVRAVEQEFTLEPAGKKRKGDTSIEYAGKPMRLTGAHKDLHYISVRDASHKYKLAVRTVQQLCRDQKVVSLRQGHSENSPWLVAEESIKAYCEAQRA